MRLRGLQQKAVGMIIAVLLMAPFSAVAAEVVFPVSAYTPEELSKVREWEKTWAGKKIDKTNVDQVAQFLPESILTMFKNQEKWGAPPEGLYFYVTPYKQIIETKGMIEATKKYAPLVKTDAEGNVVNYAEIAGFPFPAPKTGLQLAYNIDAQSRGDTYHYRWRSPSIDPRARSDRLADQEFKEMYFIHRTEVDPRPSIKKNPKGIHKAQFMHMRLPPETRNSRLIVKKYIDETKEYATHFYFAEFRRLRKLSSRERANAIDGTDMIYDDGNMWDGYISKNTYQYKGRKEVLVCRHQDMSKYKRIEGQVLPNNLTFERCNAYVVEVTSKQKDYIYSKRIWYIDPETYYIQWMEVYDQVGQFWKCFMNITGDVKTKKEEMKNFMIGIMMADFQRTHGGFADHSDIKGISLELSPKVFSLTNLRRTY